MLRPLAGLFPATEYPLVLAGLARPDDAAVYDLGSGRVAILTCDFFPPIVDDPYTFGAIAAANAVSDVYAMGGTVALGLNIAVFPACLGDDVVGEILRGGAEKMREAGGALAGGHTIEGPEPLFGMAVLGFAERGRVWSKGGARPGDGLVLTKPLGSGIITTAHKAALAAPEHLETAVRSMAALNRAAAELASRYDVHAATDITGFALVGHACEMARESSACLHFRFEALPFLPGAQGYARDWLFPAGTSNNETAFLPETTFAPHLPEQTRLLLLTPETSGGLLLAMPDEQVSRYLAEAKAATVPAWQVGEVMAGSSVVVE